MNGARTSSNQKISLLDLKKLKKTKNSDIHIVSAGPSMRNYNWEKLKRVDVMTINDTLFHLPVKITYHVYNEPLEQQYFNYFRAIRFTDLIRFTTFFTPEWHSVSLYPGENLAFQLAINIAIDLGYKKAILYGYDFECIDGYVHWWDAEPEKNLEKLNKKLILIHKQREIFDKFLPSVSKKIEIIRLSNL
jgi:hypothetical protein